MFSLGFKSDVNFCVVIYHCQIKGKGNTPTHVFTGLRFKINLSHEMKRGWVKAPCCWLEMRFPLWFLWPVTPTLSSKSKLIHTHSGRDKNHRLTLVASFCSLLSLTHTHTCWKWPYHYTLMCPQTPLIKTNSSHPPNPPFHILLPFLPPPVPSLPPSLPSPPTWSSVATGTQRVLL